MSVGAYDEAEHERREQIADQTKPDTDGGRKTYHGSIEYDSGDSTDTLLEQFKRMKSDD